MTRVLRKIKVITNIKVLRIIFTSLSISLEDPLIKDLTIEKIVIIDLGLKELVTGGTILATIGNLDVTINLTLKIEFFMKPDTHLHIIVHIHTQGDTMMSNIFMKFQSTIGIHLWETIRGGCTPLKSAENTLT